jgi:hypothetical protein
MFIKFINLLKSMMIYFIYQVIMIMTIPDPKIVKNHEIFVKSQIGNNRIYNT